MDTLSKLFLHGPLKIKIVGYRCPNIGDEGMAALSNGCKKLKKLNISYCNSLTDKGMEYIGRLEELYVLEMRAIMNVTGVGLQAVAAGCTILSVLDLKHCVNIQDAGFWALANYCKNLREVISHLNWSHNFFTFPSLNLRWCLQFCFGDRTNSLVNVI